MKTEVSDKIECCRVCGKSELEVVLDLGAQPPANSLRQDKAERLEFVPLVLCRCQVCSTLQLTQTIVPEYLFSHYVWVTGTSKGANNYSHEFCERLAARSRTGSAFVVEVASNDGTFLKPFQQRGSRVLGIDPAINIAAMASAAGVPTLPD